MGTDGENSEAKLGGLRRTPGKTFSILPVSKPGSSQTSSSQVFSSYDLHSVLLIGSGGVM